uniref:Uncharacterized protein n=1 Tax=Rhizophora mucronata TaxID=61149 RepID=A0A2P2J422_RHIMU
MTMKRHGSFLIACIIILWSPASCPFLLSLFHCMLSA